MSKVVIIGGGAAGLVAGIKASKNNDVTILEKNSVCGKKILGTGNGKCNYFNSDFSINNYHSRNIDILKTIITEANKEKVLSFFEKLGIIPKIKNGYYYPMSNQAITIQQALINEAKRCNVNIINNTEVQDISYDKKFIIKTLDFVTECDKVIIATGSKAMTSNEFGYEILKKFHHNIIKPLPALVQVKLNEPFLKEWNGIRVDSVITMFENEKYITSEEGELLLTDYGLSGICVFQLSGFIARSLDKKNKITLQIDFLPWLAVNNFFEFCNWMDMQSKKTNYKSIQNLVDCMINYKLTNIFLRKIAVTNETWEELSVIQKESLYKFLKSLEVDVCGTNSFDKAQVSSGGVPLDEINIKTMESLKQEGLYIIGELLDVDGKCGGFNLGFAWLSGLIAGEDNDKNKTN